MRLTRRQLGFLAVPVLLIAPIVVQPAKAIFGIGDIVFDPSSYAMIGSIWSQNISTYAKMIEEFNQLVKIYSTGYQLYQSAMYMRQSFSAGTRSSWMMMPVQIINNQTQSRYGETISWPRMVNGAPNMAPDAWASATVPMNNTNFMMVGMNALMTQRLRAKIASIEIADGTSVQCLQTISQQHLNSPSNLSALRTLGITFHSDNANSLIQQLNLGNAATQQAVTLAHEQSSLQNCVVQGQIAQNKILRDQQVSGINNAIETQSVMTSRQNAWDGGSPWDVRIP